MANLGNEIDEPKLDSAMTPFLCKTCGTQFAPSIQAPSRCPICEDERQYVGYGGQEWLRLPQLQRKGEPLRPL
jgi:hypothetical protein